MSGSDNADRAWTVMRFAERHGINRRRVTIAAVLLGSVLIVAMFAMNQRIQSRRGTPAADSTTVAPVAEPLEPTGERAAWADPHEARRLAGDTLPAVPRPDDLPNGGEYVPLGSDVEPGGYEGASSGQPPPGDVAPADPASGYQAAAPMGAFPLEERAPTPEDVRRAAFQRAVSSRQLRAGRAEGDPVEADSTAAPAVIPLIGQGSEREAPGTPDALRPYGPEQVEEDRRAAERAGQELVPPRAQASAPPAAAASPARFVFASAASRPCREGERILSAGYVITATLASSINSEAPGPVLARIGRDVYDAAMRCVIFPAGSLLIGRYPEGLTVGGQRLVVVWEQVVLGDGRTWTLPSLPAADRQGAIGIAGRVDRRTRETLEAAALLSAFGAAIEYATPGGGEAPAPVPGGYPSPPSARDRAVGAATEPFRGAAERLLDRAAGIRPVLRLDVGQPVAVIVPRTVDLDRPAPAPADTVPAAPRPAATQS